MPRLSLSHRSLATKLIVMGGLVTFLLTLYTMHPSSARLRASVSDIFSIRQRGECSPQDWASGQWTRRVPARTTKQNVTSRADVLEFEGFEGCASDREYNWHLSADEDQWDRFPEVTAYQWTPPASCNVRQFEREAFVRDLVEKGGWLLIGGKYFLITLQRRHLRRHRGSPRLMPAVRAAAACIISNMLRANFFGMFVS
jgi:hypothetical protein